MKIKSAIMALTFVVLVIMLIVLTSARCINQKSNEISNSSSIPDSLNKIFTNSCAYCHSPAGKFIANAQVNFSAWDEYSQKDKIKKGEAICKKLSDGAMPPKSARKSKPETIPTDAQIKSICKWTASLSQIK